MAVDERIPGYSDKELTSLRDNIARLAQAGTTQQRAEAERLKPLVDAEFAARKARAPVRAPPLKKAAAGAKKTASPKKKKAAANVAE
jgi:hypothetical protein